MLENAEQAEKQKKIKRQKIKGGLTTEGTESTEESGKL
jgi:hypothetical protein